MSCRGRLLGLVLVLVAAMFWLLWPREKSASPPAVSVPAAPVQIARTTIVAPRSSAPSLDEPAPVAGEARSADGRVVQVRDLADDTPCAQFALRLPAEGGRITRTDELGRFSLPPNCAGTDIEIDAPFLVAGSTPAGAAAGARGEPPVPVREYEVLWVYRMVEVECSLVARGVAIERADLAWSVTLGGPGRLPGRSPAPFNLGWLQKARLGGKSGVQRLAPGEVVRFLAPRVRGLAVVARDPERLARADVRKLALDATTERVHVDFAPEPCPSITGVIRSADRLPADLTVAVYVTQKRPFEEFDQDLMSLRGNTITGGGAGIPGAIWEMVYITSAPAGPHGEFRVPVAEEGEAMLEVRDGETVSTQVRLGQFSGSRSGVEVELPSPPPPRMLTLVADGAPLAGQTVLFADGGAAVGLPAQGPFVTSESGALDVRSLVNGHTYYVLVMNGERTLKGWFTWTGQSTLDLAQELRKEK